MKIAFYAPMKPTHHPVPSGDRAMGQALLRALRTAGHETSIASRFRSFDGRGDATRQERLQTVGRRLAARLVRRLRHRAARPDAEGAGRVAPPSHALDIPYVVAEASVAAKQSRGPWALGYAASVTAIEAAAAVIFVNPGDLAGVRAVRGPARADECVPPFLDLAEFARSGSTPPLAVPVRDGRARLITVAMMRPGAKLASYRLLADALAQIAFLPWELVIAGDGEARHDVEAAFARFDSGRIRMVGFLNAPTVAAWLRGSDVFVWPAIDEAFGMALIEAQACGLPVVAGNGGGVAGVVASGRTGLLVPVGDAAAFAAAIHRLLKEPELRRRMASEAPAYAKAAHDLPAAASRLDAVLRRVIAEYRQRAPLEPTRAA